VLGVAYRGRLDDEPLQLRLALEQRRARDVLAVELEEIKDGVDQPLGGTVIGRGLHRGE
jgi:hypothetical protein